MITVTVAAYLVFGTWYRPNGAQSVAAIPYADMASCERKIETQRDLLNGTLDVYLSSVANRTNQVMKVLTVLGTIALPALVVSSIFGMNLKGLPWLESPHGVGIVGAIMAVSTVALLVLLRVFRWL